MSESVPLEDDGKSVAQHKSDAEIVDPNLCLYCQEIMNRCPEGGGFLKKLWFRHHDTTSALAESANSGCVLCIHLIRSENCQVRPDGTDEDEDEYDYLYGRDDSKGHQGSAILETTRGAKAAKSLNNDFDGSRIILNIIRFNKLVTSIRMFPTFLLPHDLAPLPIARCRSSQSHRTPTRLLLLEDGNVRLCLSSELGTCPRYATLSHCWGSLSFLPLKKNNITHFQQRIPVQSITKTFQDAIRITSYLGIEYLWIDSLCIIQDDIEDWNRESPLMCDVYGGSTINLAASSAPDGSFGCFFDRHMLWGHFLRNNRGRQTMYYRCVPDDFEEYLLAQPLFKQAWVLQERLLSPRTLHFTQREVFWECEKRFACETFPGGIPTQLKDGLSHLGIAQINSGRGWAKLVNAYSSCNLTLSRDKLAAISGLARIVQRIQKDEYVAGMWRKHLISQLRWDVEAGTGRRITPYVAPTWSWASITGSIEFSFPRYYDEKEQVKVDALEIKHASDDPFGQITAATLRLICKYLIRAKANLPFSRPHENIAISGMLGDFIMLNAKLDVGRGAEVGDGNLFILPVAIRSSVQVSGLVLKATADKKGRYRRLGSFFCLGYEESVLQEGLSNPESAGMESDCVRIDRYTDGYRRYTIELV
ncbi:heterokaryon incompatibility protein-domain-containing protein [Rhexocercosporidium sp. MPI-PUGE-AT-0058]|nr:heterokaryon incompatibility protein-domain-containing protein [Rhexocercosporidium sp. MPI-PUGE-AT-0058]